MMNLFEFQIPGLTGKGSPERRQPRSHVPGPPHAGSGNQADPGGGGNTGGGAQEETQQERIQRLLQEFQDNSVLPAQQGLGEDNAFTQGLRGDVGDLRGQFAQIANGNDPRFERFKQGQFGLLNQQRNTATGNREAQLARMGLGGGTVGANEIANINNQFDTRQSALGGQIDLQQLGRQDQFLTGQAGLIGQQAGLTDQISQTRLGIAGLGALAPGLDIANTAAQNAGEGGGGGGGFFNTIICTYLHKRGDAPRAVVLAGARSRKRLGDQAYQGYLAWAGPVIRWADSAPWRYAIFRSIWLPAVMQVAHEELNKGQASRWGWLTLRATVGLSRLVGVALKLRDSRWRLIQAG